MNKAFTIEYRCCGEWTTETVQTQAERRERVDFLLADGLADTIICDGITVSTCETR